MSRNEHKDVFHHMCVHSINMCTVNDSSTVVCVVHYAQTECRLAMRTALGSSASMALLSQLNRCGLITLAMGPHRKDDPDPYIRKCSYGNRVTFPLPSFALIVVFGPRFTLGTLPRKVMQGVMVG
jgi:hypothetical protein